MTVAQCLQASGTALTKTERRIADVLLTSPQVVAFGTVAEVAAAAEAGTATVVRLATKLGHDGFVDLQSDVQSELSTQLRPAAERIRRLGAAEALALAPANAIVLAVDLRRYDQWLLDALAAAHGHGFITVAVSDSVISPLAARRRCRCNTFLRRRGHLGRAVREPCGHACPLQPARCRGRRESPLQGHSTTRSARASLVGP